MTQCKLIECSSLLKNNFLKSSEIIILNNKNNFKLLDLLFNIYELERSCEHRKASMSAMQFIMQSKSMLDCGSIDLLIELIDINRLSVYTILGIVRYTTNIRIHLPHWDMLYVKAKNKFLNNGYNAKNLLIGIKEPVLKD